MSKPYYTVAAAEDLENILQFIARDKPGAAVAWVEKISAKYIAIANAPQTGQQMPELGLDVRVSVLGRYMIFHRFKNDRLEILRVVAGGAEITSL